MNNLNAKTSSIVRIESIEIRNFKNVSYGYLNLNVHSKNCQANILGLYGQNGSGKTALIDAVELLHIILTGQCIPDYFADYINIESDFANIKYKFKITNLEEKCTYSVVYEVSIKKDKDNEDRNVESLENTVHYKATLFDEVLSYSYEQNETKVKLCPVIDTRTGDEIAFLPKSRFYEIVGTDKDAITNLMVVKRLASVTSRSFIFSKELLNKTRQNCKNTCHILLIESLVFYGNFRLFVINTQNTGLISMNTLPLLFNYTESGKIATGNLFIELDKPSLIPENALTITTKIIGSMNIVLEQLIPGLTIGMKNLGSQLNQNGSLEYRIQLVSNKNSKEIPLQYESEGIKKIISILQLLIVMYNNTSITVAIDELDSGIFEYLLGELLHILSQNGKGQLIFTSHNLRPLETIDKRFIAFTTINPENRYIRMSSVKNSNNLRDLYYRNIIIGGQSEFLYESTNNSEIALAFKEAGMPNAN